MRRDVLPILSLVCLILLFGGFAWLTRHPDAPVVRRAAEWPYIGPLARAFHERYIPPPAPEVAPDIAGETTGPQIVFVEPEIPPLGAGQIWVLPGAVMREKPAAASPKILQFDAISNVTWLERRGDWFRVWRRGREGWIHFPDYEEPEEPPYGRDPDPPKPLPGRAPDAEALAAARALLGGGGREGEAGPYALFTDVDDEHLLGLLDRAAASLEAAYAERFGRRPIDMPREAVVLFRDEGDYRALQSESSRLLGLTPAGHTTSGMVVLYVGERSSGLVAATLIHELTHLLNRRALGPALPSWLDEGLADDLAFSELDAAGAPRLGTLALERRQDEETVSIGGGVAALWQLRDHLSLGGMRDVRELLELDWESFVRGDRARLNYSAAAFFIRFLLDADNGRYHGAFQAFLADVAAGHPPTAATLGEHLETSWPTLSARFRLWIETQGTMSQGVGE